MDCPCGSGQTLADCCQPIIAGERAAASAEALMRARYSAYTQVEVDFLVASLHPDQREEHDPEHMRAWAESADWHGLEILATEAGGPDDDAGTVEFVAAYSYEGELERHHERASFTRHEGDWYFVAGEKVIARPFVREQPKVGRNEPCICGSGRKYKRCCGA